MPRITAKTGRPHNRFIWRGTDQSLSLCAICKHKRPNIAACDAFPNGIPAAFLNGTKQHRTHVEGDHGLVFTRLKL